MSNRDDRARDPEAPNSGEEPRGAEGRGILGRIVKKGIETGIGKISQSQDTVRGLIENVKMPGEVAQSLLEQVDETKRGLYTVVAQEIREFLQSTNFASDIKKILTGLAFEVKMEVRFKSVEDEAGGDSVRPDVKADATVKNTRKKRTSLAPEPPKDDEPEG
ncbi:MAG: hypothetical protein JNK72_01515 [Myxococcales bacterium]|nr:hypothetical protein [Myxococcales bacterium]